MNIEVIEYYPNTNPKKSKVQGTFHVYLEKFDLDIKGVLYVKNKKRVICYPPMKFGFDKDKKKKVQFPTISFANKKTNTDFLEGLNKSCIEYMQKNGK